MTDPRREEITRRRLVAVAVTIVCLVALIVVVQGLGSPTRGKPAALHSASKGCPRTRGQVGTYARVLILAFCLARC